MRWSVRSASSGRLGSAAHHAGPRSLFVDVGGSFDGPHTPGFYEPEQSGSASFRWSAGSSALLFPGVGRPLGPTTVRLQLSSGRGANSALLDVAVSANGHPLPPLRLTGTSEPYQVQVDPAWVGLNGDLRLDFTSPTFKSGADKRDLGFIADFARVELPIGLTIPSLTQLLWLLISALLLYGLLRTVWVTPAASGALTFAFLAGCAGVIAVQRLFLTVFTPQMALTLALALLVSLGGELVARWLSRLAGRRGPRTVPESAWTGLRALVAAGVALKVGGVLYPHTFIIDAYFHLKYITYMSEGRPWEQFFGKNLSLAVMPKEEWGPARASYPIPRSSTWRPRLSQSCPWGSRSRFPYSVHCSRR